MRGAAAYLVCAICACMALPAAAQQLPTTPATQPGPATRAELDATTERGRALQAYDQAAWHGTDAAQAAVKNDTTGLRYYIARKTALGWTVDFGTLDPSGPAFLTKIEAQSADGLHFTARPFATPRSDSGFLVSAALAIETAEAGFKAVRGYRYNVAVLPNADGTMYVYLYPAQTVATVFPLGGDERFTLNADGTKILDAHVMHHSIIAIPPETSGHSDGKLVAGFHTDVVANVPQDTDVFHVLARTPPMPDYVSAQGELYRINADGSIDYMGALKK